MVEIVWRSQIAAPMSGYWSRGASQELSVCIFSSVLWNLMSKSLTMSFYYIYFQITEVDSLSLQNWLVQFANLKRTRKWGIEENQRSKTSLDWTGYNYKKMTICHFLWIYLETKTHLFFHFPKSAICNWTMQSHYYSNLICLYPSFLSFFL